MADSPEKLQAGNGNIWDSGKTLSSASILVPFKGKELKAGQTYYWKVRSWDKEDSPSRWSCIHTFGMGLLSEKDWSNAKWTVSYTHLKKVANRWRSPENPGDGQVPRTKAGTTELFRFNNSSWVYDASYLTIKNITLGYTCLL